MENRINDGRSIKSWKCLDTETEQYGIVDSEFEGEFSYLHDYMGDHSECWIIKHKQDGTEIQRVNTRAIEFIIWE